MKQNVVVCAISTSYTRTRSTQDHVFSNKIDKNTQNPYEHFFNYYFSVRLNQEITRACLFQTASV